MNLQNNYFVEKYYEYNKYKINFMKQKINKAKLMIAGSFSMEQCVCLNI